MSPLFLDHPVYDTSDVTVDEIFVYYSDSYSLCYVCITDGFLCCFVDIIYLLCVSLTYVVCKPLPQFLPRDAMRYMLWSCVRLSVSPSQVRVLQTRLNVGSGK